MADDEAPRAVSKPAGRWSFELTLEAAELRQTEPVATVMQVLDTVQGLGALRTPLFLVLTELFSNALEHGLLELDSALKHGVNGFAEYYRLRQERLEQLVAARVDIACRHVPTVDGGELRLRLSHDGKGFEPTEHRPALAANAEFRGRGIALVRSLCESLEYEDAGRTAVAVYRWTASGGAA